MGEKYSSIHAPEPVGSLIPITADTTKIHHHCLNISAGSNSVQKKNYAVYAAEDLYRVTYVIASTCCT